MVTSFGNRKVSQDWQMICQFKLGDYYLPPFALVNMKFFKDLACGAKKALTQVQAKRVQVEKFKELNINFALQQCKMDPACEKFIPEHWFKQKAKKDRDYVWAVLATV